MTINDNIGKIINNLNINSAKQNQNKQYVQKNNTRSFADVLKKTVDDKAAENKTINDAKLRQYNIDGDNAQALTFSKHAQQRLTQRNITLEPELMAKIGDAAKKAYDKNIKNALILTEGTAFIVNTQSNIVVTTMNNSEMRDSIITNIDGTVIL